MSVWNESLLEISTSSGRYAQTVRSRVSREFLILLAKKYEEIFQKDIKQEEFTNKKRTRVTEKGIELKILKSKHGIPCSDNRDGKLFYLRIFRCMPLVTNNKRLDRRSFISQQIYKCLCSSNLCGDCKKGVYPFLNNASFDNCYKCYKALGKCKKCKAKHKWVIPALRIFFADKNGINNRTEGHAKEFMARVAEIVRIQRKELKQHSRNQLQFVT